MCVAALLGIAFLIVASSPALVDHARFLTQDAQSPGIAPSFRVSTELVQLDVVVTDPSGRAVDTLRAEDFEIRQDGKRLPVRFAEYLNANGRSIDVTPSGGQGQDPPDERRGPIGVSERSQDEVATRRIVVIVDDSYMNFDSVVRSKEALAGLVQEALRAGDLLSIVGTNDPADEPLVFTAETKELARQIGRIQWSALKRRQWEDSDFLQSTCSVQELGDDLQASSFKYGTFGVLASVLGQMRPLRGRKALILLADRIQTCPEYLGATWERLRRLADSANRSAVVIYGVQTLPFSSGVRMPEQRASEGEIRGTAIRPSPFYNSMSEFLRSLATRTGGLARRSNDIRQELDAVLADFGGYYLVAYEPPPGTFQRGKPKFRKVSVRVRDEKLKVRARPGFYSVDDERLFAR